MFYRIDLVRQGESPKNLGTVPTPEDLETWFSGAFANGLLPDPPKYTDEIQVFEVVPLGDTTAESLKWVWRLSWHQFEAARKQ